CRWPQTVLAVSALLVAASVWASSTRLQYHTSRSDLISPDKDYQKRWRAYLDEFGDRSEEHTSELQSLAYLVCRLLLEKKNNKFLGLMTVGSFRFVFAPLTPPYQTFRPPQSCHPPLTLPHL